MASSISILDVGHGNCAVLVDGGVVVIDTGPGATLLEFLTQEGINKIDVVLISHADKDHIKGLVALIASEEFEIGRVHLNSDAMKDTDLWDDLLCALEEGHLSGRLRPETSLSVVHTNAFNQKTVQIEILAPGVYMTGKGPGAADQQGRRITSNSASAVIRLLKGGKPILLLPGDLDDAGVSNLAESLTKGGRDCATPVLVFPHHGGGIGTKNVSAYINKLCDLVKPETVIFSFERGGRFTNPRPDIVAALRAKLPNVRIACTQLSKHCAAIVPDTALDHLTAKFARGRRSNNCCGGTFVIDLDDTTLPLQPGKEQHGEFIIKHAETAMCQRRPVSISMPIR